MALPLNRFKTLTHIVKTTPTSIYTTPVGISTVFLLAQVTNTSSQTRTVTFSHVRSGVVIEIVKNYKIPTEDTLVLVEGKLVLESGDYVEISGSSTGNLKFIASILESSNE